MRISPVNGERVAYGKAGEVQPDCASHVRVRRRTIPCISHGSVSQLATLHIHRIFRRKVTQIPAL